MADEWRRTNSILAPTQGAGHEAYLRGVYWLHKGTRDGASKGMAYLRDAVDKDPGDPRAYAGLAFGWTTIAHGPEPPAEAMSFAKAAAERAIQLDSTLDMAYAALGLIKGYSEWDWEGAIQALKRAIEINPHMAIAHYHLSWFYVVWGRWDEAVAEHKRAQELDPLLPLYTAWLGEIYRKLDRLDEAIAECRKAIELDPNTPTGHFVLGRVYTDQRRFEEAFAEFKKAGEVAPAYKFAIGLAYLAAGRSDDARNVLAELEKLPPTPWRAWWRAHLNSVLGNKDEAFRWLNYERPHAWLPWIRVNEDFTSLRDDPRYHELLKRMHLPPP